MNDPQILFNVLVAAVAVAAFLMARRVPEREAQKDLRITALEAENASLKAQVEALMAVVREALPNEWARHMTIAQRVPGRKE